MGYELYPNRAIFKKEIQEIIYEKPIPKVM